MVENPNNYPDWQYFDLFVDLQSDTKTITIGMAMKGFSSSWFDNVEYKFIKDIH